MAMKLPEIKTYGTGMDDVVRVNRQMIITLHQPNGASVTFHDCVLLSVVEINGTFPDGNWLRFKGKNDMGIDKVITTSLPAEIQEQ